MLPNCDVWRRRKSKRKEWGEVKKVTWVGGSEGGRIKTAFSKYIRFGILHLRTGKSDSVIGSLHFAYESKLGKIFKFGLVRQIVTFLNDFTHSAKE